MDIQMLLSFFKMIFALILVILIANVTLKFLNSKINSKGRMIKIIEKISVDAHSSIGIVQIMGDYYLMSFTEKENLILKDLSKEDVDKYLLDKTINEDFHNNRIDISKFIKRYKSE
ncbi:flagellar biosynthesis protein FliO [Soehngenia longivitae]|uniref:Flagellar biosynthesis protein FliO n=1 Tax=Soehngenia longivitae TaxID=2562294 RepID=A0A4Z0D5C5_9FIRM|nr:flagellar biosynthesis protein FliO [Soehngenia longivitae]TFZ39929.1 flagellar biosynthesis protein FliO [Soehngenia longivitae]